MPFITQGKTNLRYILIVILLAAIVGGGIWWLFSYYREIPPAKVPLDFMCSKEVTITGNVGLRDYSKIVPEAKYVICSDELASLGIKFFQPLEEDTRILPDCVPLETPQEFLIDASKPISEGPEITINGVVRYIDNRKSKNPDCEISSIGCQLIMWLKEFTKAGGL